MKRIRLLLMFFSIVWPVFCHAFAEEGADWGVAPQSQIRKPPYSAPTPLVVPGGRTVVTDELRALVRGQTPPLLVDVAGGEGHMSIPDARWLPGAGRGIHFLDPLQAAIADWLVELTRGDKARKLVFFCVDAKCWLSYNVALRAIALGYSDVLWYRGGVAAWAEAGLPLAPVEKPVK